MSELCRRMEISRKTGYKWLRRYALHDLPRCPHSSPQRTSREMEELVVAAPDACAHVLCRLYGRACQEHDHAQTNGLIDESEAAKHTPYVRFERAASCGRWTSRDTLPCNTTAAIRFLDDHSRKQGNTVQDRLTHVFRRYGLPQAMLMDNGSPWGSDSAHPFTTVWLMQLGIRCTQRRTIPKHSSWNGSLKSELLRTFTDLPHCQRGTWRLLQCGPRRHQPHARNLSPRPCPPLRPRRPRAFCGCLLASHSRADHCVWEKPSRISGSRSDQPKPTAYGTFTSPSNG